MSKRRITEQEFKQLIELAIQNAEAQIKENNRRDPSHIIKMTNNDKRALRKGIMELVTKQKLFIDSVNHKSKKASKQTLNERVGDEDNIDWGIVCEHHKDAPKNNRALKKFISRFEDNIGAMFCGAMEDLIKKFGEKTHTQQQNQQTKAQAKRRPRLAFFKHQKDRSYYADRKDTHLYTHEHRSGSYELTCTPEEYKRIAKAAKQQKIKTQVLGAQKWDKQDGIMRVALGEKGEHFDNILALLRTKRTLNLSEGAKKNLHALRNCILHPESGIKGNQPEISLHEDADVKAAARLFSAAGLDFDTTVHNGHMRFFFDAESTALDTGVLKDLVAQAKPKHALALGRR